MSDKNNKDIEETKIGNDVKEDITADLKKFMEGKEEKFTKLSEKWKQETMFLSNPTKICINSNYQDIIRMDIYAVPFIMYSLAKKPHYWFWALRAITRKNPVPEEYAGQIDKMAKHWIRWYNNNISNIWEEIIDKYRKENE